MIVTLWNKSKLETVTRDEDLESDCVSELMKNCRNWICHAISEFAAWSWLICFQCLCMCSGKYHHCLLSVILAVLVVSCVCAGQDANNMYCRPAFILEFGNWKICVAAWKIRRSCTSSAVEKIRMLQHPPLPWWSCYCWSMAPVPLFWWSWDYFH